MLLANLHSTHAAAALVLAAMALAGCGGDSASDEGGVPAITGGTADPAEETAPGTAVPEDEPASNPKSDEDRIKRTLELILTGSDPSLACRDLVTDRYLRRSYGDADGCRAAQAQVRTARRVAVDEVVISPDSVAQAVARPAGGIYDGESLRAELVLDAGTWKVDSLRANVPVGP